MYTFLAEIGLALLDSGDDHVANGGGGQTVQAGLDTLCIKTSINEES